jgi:hypothetical protein
MNGVEPGTESTPMRGKRRLWSWIGAALVAVVVAVLVILGGRSSLSSSLTLANTTYQHIGTQIVVSVVFTNTSRQLLVSAANSSVQYLTPDGWQNHRVNNVSDHYPDFVRPRQVVSYRLYLPGKTQSFQITTEFGTFSRLWFLVYQIARNTWEPVAAAAERRLDSTFHRFPRSSVEITVNREQLTPERN